VSRFVPPPPSLTYSLVSSDHGGTCKSAVRAPRETVALELDV